MYLGDGWFTHASTKKYEVVYSNLHTSKYYKKRLRICRRYLPEKKIPKETESAAVWKTKPIPVPAAIATAKSVSIKKPTMQRPVIESTSSGTYYVQVGSFTGSPKSVLLHKVTDNGFSYKMIQFPRNGTQISKLLIGPYKDKASALKVLPKVQANIEKAAFIAEIL